VNLNNQVLPGGGAAHLEPDLLRQVDLLGVFGPGVQENVGAAFAGARVRVELPSGWIMPTSPNRLKIYFRI